MLNEDVRMDNFIVREPFLRPTSSQDHRHDDRYQLIDYPAVMIDLAQTRLRSSYATEADWGASKLLEDEEGAVGYILMMLLKKTVGEGVWKYKHSRRYDQFQDAAEKSIKQRC